MSWFPIGPDFVFQPRDVNFKRLSPRNERGCQGMTSHITIDPTDPNTIYIAEQPSDAGFSTFRTRDNGKSWKPITDTLRETYTHLDPSCFAVNPDNPGTVYMGTFMDKGIYISNTHGDAWGTRNTINGQVRKIIVDPNTSKNLSSTVLYAATDNGVFRSPDGGLTWNQVLAGDVWSLVAYIPTTGTAHFYAGVRQQGVFHTSDPTLIWTNLNVAGIGLPAHTVATALDPAGNFDVVFVDYCQLDPNRVYAWFWKPTNCTTVGKYCTFVPFIYTTSSSTSAWTQVIATMPPTLYQAYYAWFFGVAPNSPGDGANDILIVGSAFLHRSIDGGQTWQIEPDGSQFHEDYHALAFSPEKPSIGVIPTTYIGTDGGIAKSSKFADPTVLITVLPADYNELYGTPDTFAWQNLNHGKQSSAVYQYASDPLFAELSYIGCQDTGIAGGNSSLGWRGFFDGDTMTIAMARTNNGVTVWAITGDTGGWAGFHMICVNDQGSFQPTSVSAKMGGVGSLLAQNTSSGSNLAVGIDKKCLAGVIVHDSDTILTTAIVANSAPQVATPASMNNIISGSKLIIDSGSNQEIISVVSTNATSFTATFTKNHYSGSTIQNERHIIVRVDETGAAVQISQDFIGSSGIFLVAVHPTNVNILYCVTDSQRVWRTINGATAGPTTVWTEIAIGMPAGIEISAFTVAESGNAFVLLQHSVTSGGITTPLFEISSGTWLPQPCASLPSATFFGQIIADPVQTNTLYATIYIHVYKVVLAGGTWTWTDISNGLPNQYVWDLWIGQIGSGANTKVLLRAGIAGRGVFERDVSEGASAPAISLYIRDNFLDLGWSTPSPDGIVNPYTPIERVWHYQSADIKIDAQQINIIAGASNFFQTDPEWTLIQPLDHVLFDELKDSSQNLPELDAAMVHVQVHNRSTTASGDVSVWCIFSHISAGVPALSKSASFSDSFPFWDQFHADGTIVPGLPSDSPWTSVGPPMILTGIDVTKPQIASWSWTIPTLPTGDLGHYCMVAFVHSLDSPINESTRMNVDEITPTNPQIGQKNLHIGPALSASSGASSSTSSSSGSSTSTGYMEEYIEFHNPTITSRKTNFLLDLRQLPPELKVSFHLSKLETSTSDIRDAVEGVTNIREESVPTKWAKAANPVTGFMRLIGFFGRLWCVVINILRLIFRIPTKPCRSTKTNRILPFVPLRFEAAASAIVKVRGVTIPAFQYGAALIRIQPKGSLPPGKEFRFDVQQWINDKEQKEELMAGGATIVVVVAGTSPPKISKENNLMD